MKRRNLIIITSVAGAALAGAGVAGVAAANNGGDDNEQPIQGDALIAATQAALAHTGGGTVTETEVGDEESMYEVEVTLESGRQVDVQLDESFVVVGAENEDEDEAGDD